MHKPSAPSDQKVVLTAVAVVAVLSVAGLTVIASVAEKQTQLDSSATKASVVNLRGKTVCLSPDEEAAAEEQQNEECVYGLEVAEGVSYSLEGLEAKYELPLVTGDTVTVTGTLEPPLEDSAYDTAGIIGVDSMRLQES